MGAVGYGDSQENPMRYEILVPSAMHESESVLDLDRAHDICYDLAQEFGYAEIRHDGVHIADYGSIMEQIADLLFWGVTVGGVSTILPIVSKIAYCIFSSTTPPHHA